MLKKLFGFLLFLGCASFAMAEGEGMHFEHGSTWQQVLDKAKTENKFIFVDFYATWCGPCKRMTKNIFPDKEVGEFYNKNYVNVKVQMDRTDADNDEVKSWYATASELGKKYQVKAYPTYLIFNSNGELVHKLVGGMRAKEFIEAGTNAMNPATQLYALKAKYDAGNKDSSLLYSLASMAGNAFEDELAQQVTNEYLDTQTDFSSEKNMKLLANNTGKSSDKGFGFIRDNIEAIDKILGNGGAKNIIRQIIMTEEVKPMLKEQTKPNWAAIKTKLTAKYPTEANQVLLSAKLTHAYDNENWKELSAVLNNHIKLYPTEVSIESLNYYASKILKNCSDIACINSAIVWSKKSFADIDIPIYIDTYANLLYKSGKKAEAISWETKAKELAIKARLNETYFIETLNKMKKGEKIHN